MKGPLGWAPSSSLVSARGIALMMGWCMDGIISLIINAAMCEPDLMVLKE